MVAIFGRAVVPQNVEHLEQCLVRVNAQEGLVIIYWILSRLIPKMGQLTTSYPSPVSSVSLGEVACGFNDAAICA